MQRLLPETERTRNQEERTEPEFESKKFARTRTEPNPVKNRTEREPKCRGSYSVLSLNDYSRYIHTFHTKPGSDLPGGWGGFNPPNDFF